MTDPKSFPTGTTLRGALRLLLLACSLGYGAGAWAERIKDLATLAGSRPNQLIGYGLVVGLDGTGDQNREHCG